MFEPTCRRQSRRVVQAAAAPKAAGKKFSFSLPSKPKAAAKAAKAAPAPVAAAASAPSNLFGFGGIPTTKLVPTRAVTKGWEGLGNDEWKVKFARRHGFGLAKDDDVYDDNLTFKERENLEKGQYIAIVGAARNFVPGGAGGRY